MGLLLETPHGSNLYGLSHEGSDSDVYRVISNKSRLRKRYARQSIVNGIDSLTTDLSTFIAYADAGVPQALEAMFSQKATVDRIAYYRNAYRADTVRARQTYHRTIVNFLEKDSLKMRRHAIRLTLNLQCLMERGRFNPTLSDEEKQVVLICSESRTLTRALILKRGIDV